MSQYDDMGCFLRHLRPSTATLMWLLTAHVFDVDGHRVLASLWRRLRYASIAGQRSGTVSIVAAVLQPGLYTTTIESLPMVNSVKLLWPA